MTDHAPRFAFMQKKAADDGIYRVMANPPKPGDVRMYERAYIEPPVNDLDPLWVGRCRDYWELQQAIYGLALTDFTMVVDYTRGTVRSYACVQRVLPGKRVPKDEHQQWFADKVKHAELGKQ